MTSKAASNGALIERDWFSLYGESWGNDVIPMAFGHPAKFSRALIRKIYQHMIGQGYVKPGDRIVDPFGGTGLGGLDAMKHGLHFVGVELEQNFVDMGQGYDCPGFSRNTWKRYQHRLDRLNPRLCPECKQRYSFLAVSLKQSRQIPSREAHHFTGNIELWNERYSQWFTNWGTAQLIQGDSRQLAAVLGGADGCVASPPYANGAKHTGGVDPKPEHIQGGELRYVDYGFTDGQLGAMPEGNHADAIDAIVSSPPFGEGETRNRSDYQDGCVSDMMSRAYTQDSQGTTPGNLAGMRADQAGFTAAVGSPPYAGGLGHKGRQSEKEIDCGYPSPQFGGYGEGNGQLGGMKDTDFDACLSSPPYAETIRNGEGPGARRDSVYHNGDNAFKQSSQAEYGDTPGQLAAMANGGFEAAVGSPPYEGSLHLNESPEKQLERLKARGARLSRFGIYSQSGNIGYGDSSANIGNENGDTFWTAARQIVEQVHMVLRPGGYAAWVTGNFKRNGKIVDFGRQWLQLCQACGFEPVEHITAWKTEYKGTQLDLWGNGHKKQVDRISFFRRLNNEKDPDNAILSEDVWIMRKA